MRFIGQGLGRQRIGFALVFALVLAGLVTVGHATTAPPDVAISMQGFKFIGPDGVDGNVTIPVGTRITWTMNDGVPIHHTSTSDAGSAMMWDSGALSTGQNFSLAFPTAGSFGYHCIFQPVSMFGTITVVAPNPLPQPKPSVAPIGGANPLPAPRPQGPAGSGNPNPLPGGRPPGNGPASGANITAPGIGAPAPAPLPIPARR